jgi:hypothetical protein
LDLLDVSFDHCLRLPHLDARQTDVLGQVYGWREPDLRFALWMRNMDVNPRLLTGEEEQSELPVADDAMVGATVKAVMERIVCAALKSRGKLRDQSALDDLVHSV